jgi:hypothetical protein
VSVRHDCERREFVRAREDDGGYLGDGWAEGNTASCPCENVSDLTWVIGARKTIERDGEG